MAKALGRNTPANFDHVKGLGEATILTPKPVVIGINWYTSFDNPTKRADGSYHFPDVAKNETLGTVRGGHCVCLVPMGAQHLVEQARAWWRFYNQGREGACEGFGHAKGLTLEKGVTFDPWFLYDEARKLEGTFPSGEGTTNHSVVKVLEAKGCPQQAGTLATRGAADGPVETITKVAWTQDVEEVLTALGRPNAQAVPLSNNWGEEAPSIVWLPVATLARLLAEEGEADCTTDA